MTRITNDNHEDFTNASDLLSALLRGGLVDEKAHLTGFDPEVYAEGKKNDYSVFSNEDIVGYFLEVDVWSEAETSDCLRLVKYKYYADEDYLVALAGPRWSIVLRRGDKDASIPKDISQRLLRALGGSVLVWQKLIPDAQWFTSKYSLASEIIHELQQKNSSVRVRDPLSAEGVQGPGEYIRESILDDMFGTAVLQVDSMVDVTLHIFIENHWAHQNADWLESYLPCSWKQVHVAGDGWVVRIVGDPGGIIERWLVGVAQNVQAILGGSVFKDGNQVAS